MDNDKLLKTIGATLETLAGTISTALSVGRPPCQVVPCASTGCSDNTGGICTGPETCARGHIKPLPAAAKGVCSEPCINIKCGYMKGGTCLQPATCLNRITPPQDAPVEELLQGYTLAQWDEIRKGGYLCEFSDGPEWAANGPVQRLLGVRNDIMASFQTDSGGHFLYCRPAQIPGVLRPWFGGDCPVDRGAKVLAIFKDKDSEIKEAGRLCWGRIDPDKTHRLEIIAYMEV